MSRWRRVAAALRGFTRGFLGIAAPRAFDAAAARRKIKDDAARRPHCC
jgi:hypothetical protein